MIDNQIVTRIDYRKESIFGLAYFVLYLSYLFVNQENEFMHWFTLVVVPLVLLHLYQKKRISDFSRKETMASVGLRKDNLTRGIFWAILLGLTLSVLQLFFSRQQDEILMLIRSGKAFLLFPLTFLLMTLTAGFTEECFFRGILQTRFAKFFKSKFWAVVLTSFLFGIYHLPYAYLNPRWPSHGDWAGAFSSALGQGIPMGLILGTLYERTENNLLACVMLHSLTNTLPAMTMIKFSGVGSN